ncbi:MAG: hypothetical protein CVT63_04510 [Candidatus Anoxymicrobium japonicum]|uniref:Prepilin type IV endopeptidase peptidase domain-containing protein n=1 Tax=Candidatus Anoxymicrobium japonicum TaxID=2013648 RepID=A0A2N3G5V8_9ACTN|nr:MAG: hypothetical protein CVT63_04510 [Candidatus Anoxymicrobium japonicum]
MSILLPIVLFCASGVAADVRFGRIPNFLNAGGLLCGLTVSCVSGGGRGLASGLLGATLGLAILLAPFLLHMVGGGDVKFLVAAGAMMGWRLLPPAFLLGAVAGGALAFFALLRGRHSRQSLESVWRALILLEAGAWRPSAKTPVGNRVRMPYSLPLSVGLIVVASFHAFI